MRNFTIIEADQRSADWKQARCGRLTGTCADAMLANGKKAGEPSLQRRDLRIRLACERLTGVPQEEDFQSRHMAYGAAREADAVAAYEAATGKLVHRTGFLSHNSLPIGCSLDGDIDDFKGILELKAPKQATHLGWIRASRELNAKPSTIIPLDHWRQLTHNLFVSGAEWAEWVSFDDRFGPELQLLIVRVHRDDVDLKAYQLALMLFLGEVDQEYASIVALKGAA